MRSWAPVLLCSSVSTAALLRNVEIRTPERVPNGASNPVEHDFASFSLPFHFFPDYAGNKSHPNLFSRDIVNLFFEKTGAHPHIRVGGTSGDRTIYNASQTQSIVLSKEYDNGIPIEVTVGEVFFEGFDNFPGTPWTFQVNLANNKSNALENALTEAKIALSHIKENLVAFEIGNEPDLYPGDVRPSNYNTADYVKEWTHYANAISRHVLQGNPYGLDSWKLFQALTFVFKPDGFTTADAFKDGIDKTGHVKTVSQHQYAAGNQGWVRLQNSFMNHTAIAGNLTQYIPDMEATKAADPGIEFLLGETNSDYVNLGMNQVEGVFGSSLWLVDYLLYGMSLNISRFNLIQGTNFGYAGWVPVPYNGQDPQVRPPLYGQILVADVIGHHRDVQIAPVHLGRWDLSAYGVYQSGILSKYVVVNFDEWNSTTHYPRPSQRFEFHVPSGVHAAEAKRLTGPGASSTSDISWGGISWNWTADGRLGQHGAENAERLHIQGKKLLLEVPSTQAVVIDLLRKK
ncbi:unnamed protein product [Penicillium manginii]